MNPAGSARDTAFGVLAEDADVRICAAANRGVSRGDSIANTVKEQAQN